MMSKLIFIDGGGGFGTGWPESWDKGGGDKWCTVTPHSLSVASVCGILLSGHSGIGDSGSRYSGGNCSGVDGIRVSQRDSLGEGAPGIRGA